MSSWVAPSGEGPDYEKRFYEVMATIDSDELSGMVSRLKTDLVDVTQGAQCGIDSEGMPYVVLRFSGEKAVANYMFAYDALVSHACPSALATMLWFWMVPYALFKEQLEPNFPKEVRAMSDPFHTIVGGDEDE